jgi:hypothetical protein
VYHTSRNCFASIRTYNTRLSTRIANRTHARKRAVSGLVIQITIVFRLPITVPAACARFSYDLVYTPRAVLEEKYKNIVHESDYDAGHFAAFEEPKILADDIFIGIEKMELFHKNMLY